MFKCRAIIILLFMAFLLFGCGVAQTEEPTVLAPLVGPVKPVGQPEVRDLGPTTETVWNCGGGGGTVIKHPSMSVVTGHAVEWEIGGTIGVGVRIGDGVLPASVDLNTALEGRYVSQFDQSIQQSAAWDLPAEPNTAVVYTLMWREVWQPGYVEVRLADHSIRVNVRYRTGIQSEVVGKRVEACDGEQATTPQLSPIPVQTTPARATQVHPTSAPVQGAGPFREHRITSTIGSGALERGTYSDGLAPFSESDITTHLNIQRIRLEENPDGCSIAFLDAGEIWFGSSVKTSVTINDDVIGEVFGPTGKHGYVFNVQIRRGDKICVTYFEASGFQIVFGPDLYYHYDSYCYRGNCN